MTYAEAAERLGFPVVLKGVADHLPHKSDLGLVRLVFGFIHVKKIALSVNTA